MRNIELINHTFLSNNAVMVNYWKRRHLKHSIVISFFIVCFSKIYLNAFILGSNCLTSSFHFHLTLIHTLLLQCSEILVHIHNDYWPHIDGWELYSKILAYFEFVIYCDKTRHLFYQRPNLSFEYHYAHDLYHNSTICWVSSFGECSTVKIVLTLQRNRFFVLEQWIALLFWHLILSVS